MDGFPIPLSATHSKTPASCLETFIIARIDRLSSVLKDVMDDLVSPFFLQDIVFSTTGFPSAEHWRRTDSPSSTSVVPDILKTAAGSRKEG